MESSWHVHSLDWNNINFAVSCCKEIHMMSCLSSRISNSYPTEILPYVIGIELAKPFQSIWEILAKKATGQGPCVHMGPHDGLFVSKEAQSQSERFPDFLG